MNQNIAILLMLFCLLAAWGWVWRGIAVRRSAQGKQLLLSHLFGLLTGSGAAFGAFCLSGALLMPEARDGSSIGVGVFGALILCAYLAVLHPKSSPANNRPKKKRVQRPSFKTTLRAYWQEEKQRQQRLQRQRADKRAAREQALGMTFGTFFGERMEAHLKLWYAVACLSICGWLFFSMAESVDGWFTRLIASGIITCLLAALLGLVSIVLIPVLLPLICISVFIEARWRIHHRCPYMAPPISSYNTEIPPPSSSSSGWLIPLAIGLWIGSTWGNDNGAE